MQAARGTSVDPTSDHPASRYWAPFAAIAVVALALDQVTKTLAVTHLDDLRPRHFVGSLLQLHLTRNPGAAFSTGTAYTGLLTVVAIVAAVVVVWFMRRCGSVAWAVALGFLLAGILGNLSDRVFRAPHGFRGHVVDFLELPHWPIFNVADVCINIAAVLILVLAYRGVRLDGGPRKTDEPAPDGHDEEPSA